MLPLRKTGGIAIPAVQTARRTGRRQMKLKYLALPLQGCLPPFSACSCFFHKLKLCLQHLHSFFSVMMLRAFILTLHHNAGRQMCDADCRRSLIDMLSACSAGRYVSIFSSSSAISISMSSSRSGITSQDAKDVCLFPAELNGEIRTSYVRLFRTSDSRKRSHHSLQMSLSLCL